MQNGTTRTVRIGGASAYYSDSTTSVAQLLRSDPPPDYLIFDFMSEGTIGMMARAMANDPEGGYQRDFAAVHIAPNLPDIAAKGIKLIANAGSMNPAGCAADVQRVVDAAGAPLTVAYVEGDDLLGSVDMLRGADTREMFSGAPFPACPESVNVYLGAFPIAQALRAGADIVVTGRCADSALALGPLIHEFGWGEEAYDCLAAGTLVGHLLECGCQLTGGTFTDWEEVPGWEDMGYPLADVAPDGSCVLSKPDGTGGLLSIGTVAEQLLYEVSDPQAYIVADVVCDFSDVRLEQVGENRVAVSGARGYPATATYKAVASQPVAWRATYTQAIIGIDAARKAQRQGQALLARGERVLRAHNVAPFLRTHVDAIGAGSSYGDRAIDRGVHEVLMRVSVDHEDRAAAMMFSREASASTSGMAPGATATVTHHLTQVSKLYLFLVDKGSVDVRVTIGGKATTCPIAAGHPFDPARIVRPPVPVPPLVSEGMTAVPLIRLAWARSGDKGNLFNVAAIARRAEYLPWMRAALTAEAVGAWFAFLYPPGTDPRVSVFDVPGFHAVNLVLHDSLDGGILVSPRLDAAAKGMAQQLLEFPVPVPSSLLDRR